MSLIVVCVTDSYGLSISMFICVITTTDVGTIAFCIAVLVGHLGGEGRSRCALPRVFLKDSYSSSPT
jgi:hypothetical protein